MIDSRKGQNDKPETAATEDYPQETPVETQGTQPGSEAEMNVQPVVIREDYRGSGKLEGKVALITGGDSGIGRAVAVHFAREGADVAILYLDEHQDAQDTVAMVEAEGRRAVAIAGDIGDVDFARQAVAQTVEQLGKLDILVNNAAEQHEQKSITDITPDQLERTFRTNIFGMFYLTQAAMPHLKEGSAIINTTSITAYKGSPELMDYASTKGAIVAFTRSLSQSLAQQKIRVNAVAPGPIWTPLIPATISEEKLSSDWGETPLGRPGQPSEVAPAYVFLASDDSSYFSGQVLHPNGGTVVGG